MICFSALGTIAKGEMFFTVLRDSFWRTIRVLFRSPVPTCLPLIRCQEGIYCARPISHCLKSVVDGYPILFRAIWMTILNDTFVCSAPNPELPPPPPFTYRRILETPYCSSFSGVIDHLFVSTGEKDSGLEISGVLAFPPGANLAEERGATPLQIELGHGDDGSQREGNSSSLAEQSDQRYDGEVENEKKQTDGHTEGEFPPIPDEVWGSDHLALGVEITVG